MNHHSLKPLLIAGGLSLAILSPAFAGDAGDMFKKMDANNDGKVTESEHTQFAETMFRQSDTDRDGKVSAAECEAAQATHEKGMKADKAATAAHLRVVDTDRDDHISRTESATHASNEFSKADKNRDGHLSKDEVADAHAAMKKKMKG